jgi:hypothetical protein
LDHRHGEQTCAEAKAAAREKAAARASDFVEDLDMGLPLLEL